MSYQNIPNELRKLKQWVVAGPDKVPINPRTGAAADPTDSATWGTFEEACRAGKKHIGFVLSANDPYSAIDLDEPQNDEQAARHQQILEAADSYAELSQSGKGVHIFLKGKIPQGVRRDKVEVYSQDRYMIMTGNRLNELPIDDNQFLLDVLFKEMATTRSAELVEQDETMTDDRVLEMARGAENADKFNLLWEGDWQRDELAYLWPSQSEADFALMAMLCFYSKSNEQCRRLFRQSQLGQRAKAQRDRYLDYMIEKCRAKEPKTVTLDEIRELEKEEAEAGDDCVGGHADAPVARPGAPAFVWPPGLVGEVAQYFHESAIRPVREIALAGALAFTAGVCGRSYNISGTGLNQYLILLARTGSGKEGIASGINSLAAALRPTVPLVDRFMGPAVFASGQGLLRVLGERPCFVSVLGEVGYTLQELSDPRANTGQRALRRVLLDLYNKSGFTQVLQPSVYSDDTRNTKMVQAPCVTLIGESTQETFYSGLTNQQIEDGLLPRFTIIEYNGERPDRNRSAFQPPGDELLDRVGNLVTIALATQQNTTCQPVSVDHTAQAMLDELDSYATGRINQSSEVERHLWNRAHLKALKLSALLAVGCNAQAPVVTGELADWARNFVFHDVSLLAHRFESGDIGDGHTKQEADLRAAVIDYGRMDAAARKSYKVPARLLNERNIIPYHYLRRRLRGVASFKNDRRGFDTALNGLIEALLQADALSLVDRRTASELGVSQRLFARGVTF